MRRLLLPGITVLAVALGVTMYASSSEAQQLPPHPHIMVLHAEIDVVDIEGEPWLALVGYHRCVDLAANRAVPLHAHHANLHFGTAGQAIENGGHGVAPTAPFPGVPWADCASFATFLPLPLDPL